MATEVIQPGQVRRPPVSTPAASALGRLLNNYVVKSLLKALFTIWFVATLIFFLVRLLPSNPIDVFIQEAIVMRGLSVDQARVEAESLFALDLDRPLPLQYLDYLQQLVTFNLGQSIVSKGTPVSSIIMTFLPWTLFTVGTGLLISFVLGIVLGTLAAYRRGTWIDNVISTFAAFMEGIPQFVLGLVIIVFFGVRLQWFNIATQRGAYTPGIEIGLNGPFIWDVLKHAWLPIVAYVLTTVSRWILLMKNATTASLEEDYVNVARARGLEDRRIASAYVARNSILPLVTYAAIALGFSLGGAAIFEQVFVYRGIGQRLNEALNARDYPVMQGILLVLTISVVISNLLADVLYGRIDPRIRIAGGSRR